MYLRVPGGQRPRKQFLLDGAECLKPAVLCSCPPPASGAMRSGPRLSPSGSAGSSPMSPCDGCNRGLSSMAVVLIFVCGTQCIFRTWRVARTIETGGDRMPRASGSMLPQFLLQGATLFSDSRLLPTPCENETRKGTVRSWGQECTMQRENPTRCG